MEKIITAKIRNEAPLAEIEQIASKFSPTLRLEVREAFLAEDEGDYEKAEGLCCRILDEDNSNPEVRMLLGRCYFSQGKMDVAGQVFFDLVQDYPKEELPHLFLGMVHHATGNFHDAVKEFELVYPLQTYHPFYFTSYGDALQQIGKKKQSREIFYEEVAAYEATGFIPSPQMLDGAYQNLLYLDIALGNQQYSEDLESYYHFLDLVEMTEEMQDYLAGNIVYFRSLMRNKGYRPLFLEFIKHIKEKNYLTEENCVEILEAAFISWELYGCHEDSRVDAIVETYLYTSYERRYTKKDLVTPEECDRIMVLAYTYEWYICQYYSKHQKEMNYIKNTYPYSYKNCRSFLEKVQNDAEKTAGEILEQLHYYVKNTEKAEFERSMYSAYEKASKDKKEPAYIYDGVETYKRIQPKVGRNDPCPCGSGKKYKKCCGK